MGDFFSQSAWRIQVFRNDAIVICHRLIYIQYSSYLQGIQKYWNIIFFFKEKNPLLNTLAAPLVIDSPIFFGCWFGVPSSRLEDFVWLDFSSVEKIWGKIPSPPSATCWAIFSWRRGSRRTHLGSSESQTPMTSIPIPSMYGIFTYMNGCFLRWNMGNVGKYTIHGCYGIISGKIICE